MTNTIGRRSAFALSAGSLLLAQAAQAQTAASGPANTVTSIEVNPAAAEETLTLLRAHATASRTETGNTRFDLLRRIDRPHHFAMIESWTSAATATANRGNARTTAFRAAIAPALIAAYDERPHTPLDTGAATDAPGAIFAVTHVDIVPTLRDTGAAAVAAFAQASRGTPGNLRFDALTQDSRPNHFTLVESWTTEATLLTHATTSHTRTFRNALTPMSGSLFDERLYRAV